MSQRSPGVSSFLRIEQDSSVDIRRIRVTSGRTQQSVVRVVALARAPGASSPSWTAFHSSMMRDWISSTTSARCRATSASGYSIFAARVPSSGENANAPTRSSLHSLQEIAERLEFLLTLAGKAGDEARAQDKARNAVAELRQKRLEVFAVAAPVHLLQDARRRCAGWECPDT